MTLVDLKKGVLAEVIAINGGNKMLATKLREVGFAEGDEVEVVHLGPLAAVSYTHLTLPTICSV